MNLKQSKEDGYKMGIWESVRGGKGRENDVNIISKVKENNVKKVAYWKSDILLNNQAKPIAWLVGMI